jgi:hypothetical protein
LVYRNSTRENKGQCYAMVQRKLLYRGQSSVEYDTIDNARTVTYAKYTWKYIVLMNSAVHICGDCTTG